MSSSPLLSPVYNASLQTIVAWGPALVNVVLERLRPGFLAKTTELLSHIFTACFVNLKKFNPFPSTALASHQNHPVIIPSPIRGQARLSMATSEC